MVYQLLAFITYTGLLHILWASEAVKRKAVLKYCRSYVDVFVTRSFFICIYRCVSTPRPTSTLCVGRSTQQDSPCVKDGALAAAGGFSKRHYVPRGAGVAMTWQWGWGVDVAVGADVAVIADVAVLTWYCSRGAETRPDATWQWPGILVP